MELSRAVIRLVLLLAFFASVPPALAQEGKTVIEIRFRGVTQFKPSDLEFRLRTRVGQPLSEKALAEDISTLFAFFESVKVAVEEEEDGVRVIFSVVETCLVASVEFHGFEAFTEAKLVGGVDTRAGTPFTEYRVERDRQVLVEMLVARGYRFAVVEALIEDAPVGKEVRFSATEGPRVVVGSLRFRGNASIAAGALLDRILHREGDVYAQGRLERDILAVDRYYREEGFLDVRVEIEEPVFSGDRERVEVSIRVEEGEPYLVEGLEIRGGLVFPADPWILEGLLEVRVGDRRRDEALVRNRRAVVGFYRRYGYPRERIRCSWEDDAARHRSRFLLVVEEGPREEEPARLDGLLMTRSSGGGDLDLGPVSVRVPGPFPLTFGIDAPHWSEFRPPNLEAYEALDHFREGDEDALRALAENEDTDPWLVVDELCSRGEYDAARAFAEAGSSPDTRSLPEHVTRVRRGGRRHDRLRRLIEAGPPGRESTDRVLAEIRSAEGPEDEIASVLVTDLEGYLLYRRGDLPGSVNAYRRASVAAERLGWLREAAGSSSRATAVAARLDLRGAREHLLEELRLAGLRERLEEEATFHRSFGMAELALGFPERAPAYLSRALAEFESAGRNEEAYMVLWLLVVARHQLGDDEGAHELVRRARQTLNDAGDEQRRATCSLRQAGLYVDRRDYARALECCEEALRIARAAEAAPLVRAVMAQIGGTRALIAEQRVEEGEYREAFKEFTRALEDLGTAEDRVGTARVKARLGHLQLRLGSHTDALEVFEEALAIQRELGDNTGVAEALGGIVSAQCRGGDCLESETQLDAAFEIWRTQGNLEGIAGGMRSRGLVSLALGRADEAVARLEHSLRIWAKLAGYPGSREGRAETLHSLGEAHHSLGDATSALQRLEEALALRREAWDRAGTAETLEALARVYRAVGDPAAAITSLEAAAELWENSGAPSRLARAYLSLAEVRRELGRDAEVREDLKNALRWAREALDRGAVCSALLRLAGMAVAAGEDREGLSYLEEALEASRGSEGAANVGRVLGGLADVRARIVDSSDANDLGKRLRARLEEIGNVEALARTHLLEGWSRYRAGDLTGAADSAGRCVALAREGAYRRILVDGLLLTAQVHHAAGRHREALASVDASIEALPDLVRGLGEEEGARARERWRELFVLGTRCALALGDTDGFARIVESGRAGSLLESLGGREGMTAAIPEDLRRAEAFARLAERAATARLARARETGDPAEARDCDNELAKAQGELVRVTERIRRLEKVAADALYPRARSLTEIWPKLGEHEVLLLYALLPDLSAALVVSRKAARIVHLGPSGRIEAACRKLGRLVVKPSSVVRSPGERGLGLEVSPSSADWPHGGETVAVAAMELSGLIVDPLGLGTEMGRVLVSPDGLLATIPFSLALPGREVALVPSGTTLCVLAEEEERRRGEPQPMAQVLALGDPASSMPTAGGGGVRSLSEEILRSGAALPPLPGSRAEAQEVGDVCLLGEEATEGRFRDVVRAGGPWRAVHFACHGLIRTDHPLLSSLALGADAENDGFLTVLDVFRERIPADLVVLSPARRPGGRIYRAEGVVGFTRAFMHAGTPRVLCSLWSVDDDATRALMVKFYELWNPEQGKGLRAATALERAQAFVRSHGSGSTRTTGPPGCSGGYRTENDQNSNQGRAGAGRPGHAPGHECQPGEASGLRRKLPMPTGHPLHRRAALNCGRPAADSPWHRIAVLPAIDSHRLPCVNGRGAPWEKEKCDATQHGPGLGVCPAAGRLGRAGRLW